MWITSRTYLSDLWPKKNWLLEWNSSEQEYQGRFSGCFRLLYKKSTVRSYLQIKCYIPFWVISFFLICTFSKTATVCVVSLSALPQAVVCQHPAATHLIDCIIAVGHFLTPLVSQKRSKSNTRFLTFELEAWSEHHIRTAKTIEKWNPCRDGFMWLHGKSKQTF